MTRRRVIARLSAAILVVGAVCWVGGFAWFLQATRRPPEPPPPHVDGIVALTGGAGRVELALHLLAKGRADDLLLSGIGAMFGMVFAYRINAFLMRHYEVDRMPWYYLPVGVITLLLIGQVSVLGPTLRASSVPPVAAMRR